MLYPYPFISFQEKKNIHVTVKIIHKNDSKHKSHHYDDEMKTLNQLNKHTYTQETCRSLGKNIQDIDGNVS